MLLVIIFRRMFAIKDFYLGQIAIAAIEGIICEKFNELCDDKATSVTAFRYWLLMNVIAYKHQL